MTGPDQDHVQSLLARIREGDGQALDELVPLVFAELHELARVQRGRWRNAASLNTTALVNEAYIKLAGQAAPSWRDKAHFMAVAATAMRHILVDHSRRRRAAKRGGGRVPLSFRDLESALAAPERADDTEAEAILLLESSLERLATRNTRQMRVVECRFFGGMTNRETAAALGVSEATVKREWTLARTWLYREMRDSEGT